MREQSILDKANHWANAPEFDEETRREIQGLLSLGQNQELADRFYADLSLGTGGMRGLMGAGTCRMNVYNIRKASTAFANYLKKVFPTQQGMKIAISYDSRHNSHLFAKTTAEVFAAYGFKVLITQNMRPVPYLSFMVRHFACSGGICITASHNPPAYNGYKIYWGDGGQLTPPHDDNVIAEYQAISSYDSCKYLSYEQGLKNGTIKEIEEELDKAYIAAVKKFSSSIKGKDNCKIVYSPLHGTGIYAVPSLLKEFGFTKIYIPSEQSKPDGAFPTVKSPNPEDEAALSTALELARKEDADIVLATDPDADRLGVISKDEKGYIRLSGNQLAVLLCHYVFSNLKIQGKIPPRPYIIKTIVTTDLLQKIATSFNAQCDETLTGFKWIGERMEIENQKPEEERRSFICGGEESYGFLIGEHIRDKDGVITAALAAQMQSDYKEIGKSLSKVLDEIYLEHGLYQDDLLTLSFEGQKGAQIIKNLMHKFRNYKEPYFAGLKIEKILDYNKDLSLKLPLADVLQFNLEQGCKFVVRPSGTEPKIKFYLTAVNPLSHKDKANLKAAKAQGLMVLERMKEKLREFSELDS